MIAVNVSVLVKPEYLEEFFAATKENVQNSVKEAGIHRFDFLQNVDNPTNFLLFEVYENIEAIASHKETEHYKKWRSTVEVMMAEPRKSVKYKFLILKK